MYKDGVGIAQNYKEAMKWYVQASEQQYPGARNWITRMYERAEGVPESRAEIAKWWRWAGNVAYSRRQIAWLYEKGKGVKQDYSEAYLWYSLSVSVMPDDATIKARDEVSQHLTAGQIEVVQQKIKDMAGPTTTADRNVSGNTATGVKDDNKQRLRMLCAKPRLLNKRTAFEPQWEVPLYFITIQ